MSEDEKSMQNDYEDEIFRISEPGQNTKNYYNAGFNVDCWISFDFTRLKHILNYLLENDKVMKEFRDDMNFRSEILKNRVDQLVGETDTQK